MREVVIKTVSRHLDPKSKHYMTDWTAGDVVGIYPAGTLIGKDGNVKHLQQNKTSLIILLDDDIALDYIGGAKVNPLCTQLTKERISPVLYRSERIVLLENIMTEKELIDCYNKELVNKPFLFKGSYLDLFSDRSERISIDTEYDKSGSADNATYIIGPDGGADYATFLSFEADLAATLNGPTIGDCDGSKSAAQETGALTINGTTTAADKYIKMVASGTAFHGGKKDAAKQQISVSNSSVINVNDDYVRLEGLQIVKAASSGDLQACIVNAGIAAGNMMHVNNCIMEQAGNASYNEPCIYFSDADQIAKIWNNVQYGSGAKVSSGNSSLLVTNAATIDVYNSTIKDGYKNIDQDAGTVNIYNTICYASGAGGALSGTFGTTNYNATDDATGGTNSIDSVDFTSTPYFVDAANGDFTLTADAASVIDATSDQSGGLFSDDIAGNSRTGSWCVGASEYVAAGGLSIPVAMHQYQFNIGQ